MDIRGVGTEFAMKFYSMPMSTTSCLLLLMAAKQEQLLSAFNLSAMDTTVRDRARPQLPSAHTNVAHWTEAHDHSTGDRYFVNTHTGATSFSRPKTWKRQHDAPIAHGELDSALEAAGAPTTSDPGAVALMRGLLAGGKITQAEYDSLAASHSAWARESESDASQDMAECASGDGGQRNSRSRSGGRHSFFGAPGLAAGASALAGIATKTAGKVRSKLRTLSTGHSGDHEPEPEDGLRRYDYAMVMAGPSDAGAKADLEGGGGGGDSELTEEVAALVSQLRGSGMRVHVEHVQVVSESVEELRPGKRKRNATLLLLTADDVRLMAHANRQLLGRWLHGRDFEEPRFYRPSTFCPTPAERVQLVEDMLGSVRVVEDGRDDDVSLLHSALVLQSCVPHDLDGNERLLASLRGMVGGGAGRQDGKQGRHRNCRKLLFIDTADLTQIRNVHGDQVGYFFAFSAFYLRWLGRLAPVGLLMQVLKGALSRAHWRYVQPVWAMVVVCWACLFMAYWDRRNKSLNSIWHAHQSMDAFETKRHQYRKHADEVAAAKQQHEASKQKHGGADGDRRARFRNSALHAGAGSGRTHLALELRHLNPDAAWRADLVRHAKMLVLVPIALLLFCCVFAMVSALFAFEMWLIFDWGGCKDKNLALLAQNKSATCIGSDEEKGMAGWAFEITPGIAEALIFCLLLIVFRLVATVMANWQNWPTQEKWDASYCWQIFAMEFFGYFAWFFFLAFFYVPEYDGGSSTLGVSENACDGWVRYVDIRCTKNTQASDAASSDGTFANYELRLQMFYAYMVMPFLVNQMLNSLINTLFPLMASFSLNKKSDQLNRCDRCCHGCCLCLWCLFGQHRMLTDIEEPVEKDEGTRAGASASAGAGAGAVTAQPGAAAPPSARSAVRLESERLQQNDIHRIMRECSRPDYDVLDAFVITMLNFAFLCYFSIVFPLGPACAWLNTAIEIRSQGFALTRLSQRPVPRASTGIGSWRPIVGVIVYSSIFINTAIYLLPLDGISAWGINPSNKTLTSVLAILVFERLGTFVMQAVNALIPDVGPKVQRLRRHKVEQFKQKYLARVVPDSPASSPAETAAPGKLTRRKSAPNDLVEKPSIASEATA